MNMRFLINEVVSHEEIKDLVNFHATETAKEFSREPSNNADWDCEAFAADKRSIASDILKPFHKEGVEIEDIAIEIKSILDEYWDYYLETLEEKILTLRKADKG